jgi:hypothetical protein
MAQLRARILVQDRCLRSLRESLRLQYAGLPGSQREVLEDAAMTKRGKKLGCGAAGAA